MLNVTFALPFNNALCAAMRLENSTLADFRIKSQLRVKCVDSLVN